ncbi:hypothetical protein FQA39_LY13308 [Lamprigera yunnana]|nr:hypothetical protein FQA39_LY13308 [Lamprigera yunnana]
MARFIAVLLLVITCLNTAQTSDEFLQMLKSRKAARYCGPNLSEVLSLVCKGKYNTPPPIHDIQRREANLNGKVVDDFPFASRASLQNFIKKFKRRRNRRGVYNECCENPCSYDILLRSNKQYFKD